MPNDEAYHPDNIFAKILRGDMACHKVYEDNCALAFMDVMPQADGHTLVIPKQSATNLFTMPPDIWGDYMRQVQRVAAAVKTGMDAEGLLVLQFNGPVAGQTVFHLHFHLIPRWSGVSLRGHTGNMVAGDVLAKNAERIRAALGQA